MSTNDPLTIIQGDALSSLREMESESVQTCVTSPPYWGLRSYGTEPIVWGGDPECVHVWDDGPTTKMRWGGADGASDKQKSNGGSVEPMDGLQRGSFCQCGAWRGELGLEPTPELYVTHLTEIFRQMRRVLKNDGTAWINLGDSYCTTAPGTGMAGNSKTSTLIRNTRLDKQDVERARNIRPQTPDGLKPKDLVGIPWRVAFALQADGWYLRSDVIWAKRVWMPESVTDRPTRSHEYIFLLSKSEQYLYNQDAVREPYADATAQRLQQETFARQTGGPKDYANGTNGNRSARRALENLKQKWDNESGESPEWVKGHSGYIKADGTVMVHPIGRNRRSVWTLSPEPFPEAHFATFPTELPRICILAGSNAGDTVLDPFAGSGTTGKVAIELGRKAILIEPKAEYIEMIKRRCQTTIGLPLAI